MSVSCSRVCEEARQGVGGGGGKGVGTGDRGRTVDLYCKVCCTFTVNLH